MLDDRVCGILLPVTSLPSPYGIGDMGGDAYRFVDFLKEAGQSIWQVLPLHPISSGLGNSPYSSGSAFAGNPLLISPEELTKQGYLTDDETGEIPPFNDAEVDYDAVHGYKYDLLDKAYRRFRENSDHAAFNEFCREHSFWLDDFALYSAIKEANGNGPWYEWTPDLRKRREEALESMRRRHFDEIDRQKFYQFLFFSQWTRLKDHAGSQGVRIVGDIPIYVNGDSADTWSHQKIFKLREDGRPTLVSGVPPDYFSKTGQLWGNPVYDWEALKRAGFEWWLTRLAHMLTLYDAVRIDHFRGLIACWEVPAGQKTAVNGNWVPVPHEDFFRAVREKFDGAPIIAEDLGTITDDVRQALKKYGYPGMKILQFAFGNDDPKHPYLPHNYITNCIVYTGTHDNNTVRGWFETEARPKDKERMFRYIGRKVGAAEVHRVLMRLAYASVAAWAILPMQDVLGLGEKARINRPATSSGNWKWRLTPGQLTGGIASDLRELARTYGRLAP